MGWSIGLRATRLKRAHAVGESPMLRVHGTNLAKQCRQRTVLAQRDGREHGHIIAQTADLRTDLSLLTSNEAEVGLFLVVAIGTHPDMLLSKSPSEQSLNLTARCVSMPAGRLRKCQSTGSRRV